MRARGRIVAQRQIQRDRSRMAVGYSSLSYFSQAFCQTMRSWHGAADAGRWMHQTNLPIPSRVRLAHIA